MSYTSNTKYTTGKPNRWREVSLSRIIAANKNIKEITEYCHFVQCLLREFWQCLKNYIYDPAIPILAIYSKDAFY